ncbi:MAG: FtsQ-type POTRA domain-containing protein [Actinobacteria bacterium]|nr:FtsQ-type POTRA domain-containing protein [Actinomycetota bacterium]
MKRPGGFDGEQGEVAGEQTPSQLTPTPIVAPALAETIDLSEVRSKHLARAVGYQAVEPRAAEPQIAEPSVDSVQLAEDSLKRAKRERRGRERREQRRFTEHLRIRRRRWLVAGGAVVGLALFVVVGVFTPIMAVRDIQIQGAQTVNIEELQHSLSRFEGVPLALVSDQDVHRAVEPFPLIQRYAIERIPPHTLVVRVQERTAVIAMEREGGFALLDPAGVLLGRVTERPAGVPLGSPELTDTASPAFLSASRVIRDMPGDLREQLVSVRASNAQDVSFVLAGGTEVLWGEANETQRKSVVLRSLLASIGAPSLIDVSAPEAPVFK